MDESCLAEEIEVLEAIYIHELEVGRDCNGEVAKILLQLHPATGDDVEQQFVCMTLILDLPKTYPEEPPDITIKNPRGIGEEEVQSLLEDMHTLSRERRGGAMLYELIELAKDSLTSGNIPRCACMICLEHFCEGDSFTKTECYHYFHQSCLSRYTRHMLSAKSEVQEAYARHAKAEEDKLVCPVCREEIRDCSEELPDFVEDDQINFTPSEELRAMQREMAAVFEKQKAKGGIIDVEAERNKYLIKKDDVVHLKSVASDPNIHGKYDLSNNRQGRDDTDRPGSGRDVKQKNEPRINEKHDRGKRRPDSGYDRDKGREKSGFLRGKGRGNRYDSKPHSDDEATRRNLRNRDRYYDGRREQKHREDWRGYKRNENHKQENDRVAKSTKDSERDSKSKVPDSSLSDTKAEAINSAETRIEQENENKKPMEESEKCESLNVDKDKGKENSRFNQKRGGYRDDTRGKEYYSNKKYDSKERHKQDGWRDRKEPGNRPNSRQSDRRYGRNGDRSNRNYGDRDFVATDERFQRDVGGRTYKDNDRTYKGRDRTNKGNDRTYTGVDKNTGSDRAEAGNDKNVSDDVSKEAELSREKGYKVGNESSESACDRSSAVATGDVENKPENVKDGNRDGVDENKVPAAKFGSSSGRRRGQGRGRAKPRFREDATNEAIRKDDYGVKQDKVDSVETDLRNLKISKTDYKLRNNVESNNFHEKARNKQLNSDSTDKDKTEKGSSLEGKVQSVVEKAKGPPGFRTKPPPGFNNDSTGVVKPPPGI